MAISSIRRTLLRVAPEGATSLNPTFSKKNCDISQPLSLTQVNRGAPDRVTGEEPGGSSQGERDRQQGEAVGRRMNGAFVVWAAVTMRTMPA
jgi:hypothetical protein